jgi:hypothetical protein
VYLPQGLAVANNYLLPGFFTKGVPFYLQELGIVSPNDKREYFGDFLSRFSEEVERASVSHHTVVVTSEHLFYLKPVELAQLHEYISDLFDVVDVVCYFREPISHAVSSYNQRLRGRRGNSSPISEFVRSELKGHRYDYQLLVDKWASVFGASNFYPRLFERNFLVEGDIRRDFLSMVIPDDPGAGLDWSIETANESVGALQAAALRGVNRLVPASRNDSDAQAEPHKLLVRAIRRSSALAVGKVSYTPASEDLERSRVLTAEFLRRNFPGGESFSEYVPAPVDQAVSLQVAEAAVEEAITIGLQAGSVLSSKQVDLLRDVALKIGKGQSLSLDDAVEVMKIACQSRPDDELLQRKVDEWERGVGGVSEGSGSVRRSWFERIKHRVSRPLRG